MNRKESMSVKQFYDCAEEIAQILDKYQHNPIEDMSQSVNVQLEERLNRLRNITKNPDYNIKLGSYYLAGLLEQYEGSYPFTLAAYNAGPKRVKYWKKINGSR